MKIIKDVTFDSYIPFTFLDDTIYDNYNNFVRVYNVSNEYNWLTSYLFFTKKSDMTCIYFPFIGDGKIEFWLQFDYSLDSIKHIKFTSLEFYTALKEANDIGLISSSVFYNVIDALNDNFYIFDTDEDTEEPIDILIFDVELSQSVNWTPCLRVEDFSRNWYNCSNKLGVLKKVDSIDLDTDDRTIVIVEKDMVNYIGSVLLYAYTDCLPLINITIALYTTLEDEVKSFSEDIGINISEVDVGSYEFQDYVCQCDIYSENIIADLHFVSDDKGIYYFSAMALMGFHFIKDFSTDEYTIKLLTEI